MQVSQAYGKLPHELLHLSIAELNFDIAITLIGNKKLQELQEKERKNSNLDNGNAEQMSIGEFEKTFNVQK